MNSVLTFILLYDNYVKHEHEMTKMSLKDTQNASQDTKYSQCWNQTE